MMVKLFYENIFPLKSHVQNKKMVFKFLLAMFFLVWGKAAKKPLLEQN